MQWPEDRCQPFRQQIDSARAFKHSNGNQDRNQKSNEQNLSPAPVPEEEPNRRSDNHQDRIGDRYPGDRVFVHDRTMIKPDLDQHDAKTQ